MPDESTRGAVGEITELRRRLAAQLSLLVLRAEKHRGRGIDRAELARRLNISRSSLYAYLNGTTLPRGETFDRLLHALGATDAEFRRLSTLRDDAEVLRKTDRGTTPGRAVPPPPRQLPAVIGRFVGRGAELARLEALLTEKTADTIVIAAIDGTAGSGKTTLGLRWAHRIACRYPDGQLYVNLRGFDPDLPVEPEQALHGFLQALGASPEAIPTDLDGKVALYRSLAADQRMLVFLDNARTATQVRPLLPGSPSCLVIITGRNQLESLIVREGAECVTLGIMPIDDARELLASRLGTRRVADEATAADELVELCARLPLALGVASARVGRRSLASLVGRLRDVHDRLDALGSDEPEIDLRTVFQTSYALLPRKAARLFWLLGLHSGPDVDEYACAALLGDTSPAAAARLLAVLAGASLVDEHADGRFGSHDLLRVFARQRAEEADPRERRAALERVLGYYVNAAIRASQRIRPYRADELPTPGPSWPTPPIDTFEQAMAWFTAELPTLEVMIVQAAAQGCDSHAWQLAWAVTVFLRRTGRRAERVRLHRVGLVSAERAGTASVRATAKRLLADGLARLGEFEEAVELLETSLEECRALGEARGVFQAHLSLVRALEAQGHLPGALRHAEAALALTSDVGDLLARADGLNALARQQGRLGMNERSLSYTRRALALYERLGFPEGEADVLRTLGHVERRLGRYHEATAHLERALELDRRLNDRFWQAHVLNDLADVYELSGAEELSRASRKEALTMFELLRHPMAEMIRAML